MDVAAGPRLGSSSEELNVSGLNTLETIHILLQIERVLEAEVREQNMVSKTRGKLNFLVDKLKEEDEKTAAEADAFIEELSGIPAQRAEAFSSAREMLDDVKAGIGDLSDGLKHMSNSLGNSEGSAPQSGEKPPETKTP